MNDIPDDLSSVGRHRGNPAPTQTGQEVRSPEGPDPRTNPSKQVPALFQLVQDPDADWVQIRVHSPRAKVKPPEDGPEEIGQYRSVDALRSALDEASIGGRTAVFEDADEDKVLIQSDVSPSHAWIGRPRYKTVTFVADDEAADEYVRQLDSPSDPV